MSICPFLLCRLSLPSLSPSISLPPPTSSLSLITQLILRIRTNSGTGSHTVKVFNFDGKELSRVEPYSSFLHQARASPIAATAFHPHRMMLAASARGDNHVNLWTCGERKGGGGGGDL
jgi:hypothetical protein